MNTVKKRKIEAVINADIAEKISEYNSARHEELSTLTAKFTKNPPKNIVAMVEKIKANKAEGEELEKELHRLGWDYSDYTNRLEMRTECNGWHAGITVQAQSLGDTDFFTIYFTGGSNGGNPSKLLLTIDEKGNITRNDTASFKSKKL